MESGKISDGDARALLGRIVYTVDKSCFAGCDIVIECIVEDLEVKRSFFSEISRIARPDAILATNTSGLSINAIAKSVFDPKRFIGMHWFNPSNLVPLIEIIKGDETREEVARKVRELSLAVNKKPVVVQKDVPGFAANRIQFAVLREALSLVEEGVVSKEGIDDVMKYGLGFRYACCGPLEVADFGGLDTFYHIAEYLVPDLCDSKEVPASLRRCYEEGYYGVKSGRGFYDYSDGRDVEATRARDEKYLAVAEALYSDEV